MARKQKQTLDHLIDLFTPEIRDIFIAAMRDVTDNAIIADVIKAIENGDPVRAFEAIGFSPAAMRPITDVIERAFERGGVLTGETFPKYLNTPSGRVIYRFDTRNSRSEAWLREHSSQLVTRLTDEARSNVRTVLERGMLEGRNPRSVALDLVGRVDPTTKQRVGGIIGLTVNQENWVASARRRLVQLDSKYLTMELRDRTFDRVVQRAITEGRSLPADTVDKIIVAYKNNALRYRGEAIARTEAIQSLNRAEWEAHMQAVDIGALRQSDVRRHWDSSGDSRVRWSHRGMDRKYQAEGVGLEEPFVSPSGAMMMFPGDTSLGAPADEVVMCRCRVRLKVDFLAGWND